MINNRINIHTTGFLSSIFITDTGPCSTQGDDDIYSNNLQIFPFVLTLRISQRVNPSQNFFKSKRWQQRRTNIAQLLPKVGWVCHATHILGHASQEVDS